jgi:hypothetical protein
MELSGELRCRRMQMRIGVITAALAIAATIC